jgi:hypothetical protein
MSKNVWATVGTATGGDDEKSVQACINRALTYLLPEDQAAFRKKFREQADDEHQVMHTFRELLAGVFVARQGFTPRYEPDIDGLTPDWRFRSDGAGEFMADVVNFHIDKKVESEQDKTLAGSRVQMWCDWMPDNSHRLYQTIKGKAGKHKAMALKGRIPFVVIVYGWFSAALLPDQVESCLLPENMLFDEYPTLTGVYHMDQRGNCLVDASAGYTFAYYENAKAAFAVPQIQSGVLPYLFPARP